MSFISDSEARKPKQGGKNKKADPSTNFDNSKQDESNKKVKVSTNSTSSSSSSAKLDWQKEMLAEMGKNASTQNLTVTSYGGGQGKYLLLKKKGFEAANAEARRKKEAANQMEITHALAENREPNPNALNTLAKSKLEQIFEAQPNEIRKPRSFAGDRVRQVLRWTATCVLQMYPDGIEVQCYYANNKVFIASNIDSVNQSMDQKLKGNIIDIITKDYNKITGSDNHTRRHADKLMGRSTELNNAQASTYPEQDPVLRCLMAGNVEIVTEGDAGLHAERRIQLALKKQLDGKNLAGNRRPCGICADTLDLMGQANPGPVWISRAATQGKTPLQFVLDIAEHVEACDGGIEEVVSHVTQTREGNLTTDFGSESDSDMPQTESRSSAKKPVEKKPVTKKPAAKKGAPNINDMDQEA